MTFVLILTGCFQELFHVAFSLEVRILIAAPPMERALDSLFEFMPMGLVATPQFASSEQPILERPRRRLIATAVLLSCSFVGCAGGESTRAVPQGAVRTTLCNIEQTNPTQPKSTVRRTEDDCDDPGDGPGTGWDTPSGDPGQSFDGGDTFYSYQDQYGNPCPGGVAGGYALIGCVSAKNNNTYTVVSNSQPENGGQVGEMGGGAARGDNCEPIPNMAIGLPVPGAKQRSLNGQPIGEFNDSATVTNMSTITITFTGGDQHQLGFVYGTKGDGYFFAPNVSLGVAGGPFTAATLVPPVFALPSSNVNSPTDLEAINSAFASLKSTYGYESAPLASALTTAIYDVLNRITPQHLLGTTNCFTKALPKNG